MNTAQGVLVKAPSKLYSQILDPFDKEFYYDNILGFKKIVLFTFSEL